MSIVSLDAAGTARLRRSHSVLGLSRKVRPSGRGAFEAHALDFASRFIPLVRGAEVRTLRRLVAQAIEARRSLEAQTTEAIQAQLDVQREALRMRRHEERSLPIMVGLVVEVVRRTIGLTAHPVQLYGAMAMLRNRVIEMEAGEGKTLTAVLTAAISAFQGQPVHVVTTNDYLADRDASAMAPAYRALGLQVGLVVESHSPRMRRVAYDSDVTYVSNKEVAFDFLRDRILDKSQLGQGTKLLPRLSRCIVDEIDSVLIDEAGTPLVLSDGSDRTAFGRETLQRILDVAITLEADRDFIEPVPGAILPTESGMHIVEQRLTSLGDIRLGHSPTLYDLVCKALTALHLLRLDEHYLIADGKIQIIDGHEQI